MFSFVRPLVRLNRVRDCVMDGISRDGEWDNVGVRRVKVNVRDEREWVNDGVM